MRLSGLPNVQRRRPGLAWLLWLANGLFGGVLAFSLTSTAVWLWRNTAAGITPVVFALGLLLSAQIAIAWWGIARTRRIRRLVALGRMALLKRDTEGARAALTALISFPEYKAAPESVLYGLAVADVMDGQEDRAIELLRACGAHVAALELRAVLYLRRGLPERARRITSILVERRPGDPLIWVLAAAAEQAAGNRADSEALIEQAAEKFSGVPAVDRAALTSASGGDLLEVALVAMPELARN